MVRSVDRNARTMLYSAEGMGAKLGEDIWLTTFEHIVSTKLKVILVF